MKLRSLAFIILASLGIAHGEVVVTDAWVRATVPHQKATGAFMDLKSKGSSRLISASSPLTKSVEIHEMIMEGDVMKMREVKNIELPDDKPVHLAPGGYHIMLLDLADQVKEGDSVALVLVFEKEDGTREKVEISAKVRALSSGPMKSSASSAKKVKASCCDVD